MKIVNKHKENLIPFSQLKPGDVFVYDFNTFIVIEDVGVFDEDGIDPGEEPPFAQAFNFDTNKCESIPDDALILPKPDAFLTI
jgi:hypothetical protein